MLVAFTPSFHFQTFRPVNPSSPLLVVLNTSLQSGLSNGSGEVLPTYVLSHLP